MSKTLQFSVFTNLRLASQPSYTPAHNKNGVDISSRLTMAAYLNENRRGKSEDKSEAISLTAWGTAADILAWTLTPGKEFTAFCDLNVYKAPVYHNNQIVQMEGVALERKAYGYTIRRFDLGNDSFKHISNEIQAGTRGVQFWVKGSQDAVNFKALLDSRIAAAKGGYNAQAHGANFGFAAVKNPNYQFSPYVGKGGNATTVAPAAAVGNAVTADAVAATFTGAQAATPANPAASFTMPQTSVPAGV